MTWNTTTDDLLLAQAAPDLDMTPRRLRSLIRSNRFPGYKKGNRWYVTPEDVARAEKEGLPKVVPQRHDRTYRHLFSHPEAIEDLLRGFFDESWVDELDFSTLKKVSEAFVSDRLTARWADMVWELKWRDWDMQVCLLFEFQSTPEPYMPVRWLPILGAFYQDHVRQLGEKAAPLPDPGGPTGYRPAPGRSGISPVLVTTGDPDSGV